MNGIIPTEYLDQIKKLLDCKIHSCEFLPNSGCATDSVLINDDLIALFSKGEKIRSAEKTLLVANAIRNRITLPIPEAVAEGEKVIIFKRFPGQSFDKEILLVQEESVKNKMADELGLFLKELQAVPLSTISNLKLPDRSSDYSVDELEKKYDGIIKVVAPHIKMGVALMNARNHCESWFNSADHKNYEPVLLHGELVPIHIFFNKEKLTGVVDFGEASIGDPALDLLFLIWGYGQDFVNKMVSKQPILKANLNRARFLFGFMMLDWIRRGIELNEPKWFAQFLSLPFDFQWLK